MKRPGQKIMAASLTLVMLSVLLPPTTAVQLNVGTGEGQIDIRTRQAGLMAPFGGDVDWDNSTKTLAISVGARLVPMDLLVELEWLVENIPQPMNASHQADSHESIGGEEYVVFDFGPGPDISVKFVPDTTTVPLDDVLPFVGRVINAVVAGVEFRSPGGLGLGIDASSGNCPYDAPSGDSKPRYLGGAASEWKSRSSGSTYTRQVDACLATTNDGTTDINYVFWMLTKSNSGGRDLIHSQYTPSFPCDASKHYTRAYCIQLQNGGQSPVGYFSDHGPASYDECSSSTWGIEAIGFGVQLPIEQCDIEVDQHMATNNQARWSVEMGDPDDHSFLEFDFGVVHRLPGAADLVNSKLALLMTTHFHCWWDAYYTCQAGQEPWDLESEKLNDDASFEAAAQQSSGPDVVLGSETYVQAEIQSILMANQTLSANRLARALYGAEIMAGAGANLSLEAVAAIATGHAVLESEQVALPVAVEFSDPGTVQAFDDALRELLDHAIVVNNYVE